MIPYQWRINSTCRDDRFEWTFSFPFPSNFLLVSKSVIQLEQMAFSRKHPLCSLLVHWILMVKQLKKREIIYWGWVNKEDNLTSVNPLLYYLWNPGRPGKLMHCINPLHSFTENNLLSVVKPTTNNSHYLLTKTLGKMAPYPSPPRRRNMYKYSTGSRPGNISLTK